MKKILTFLLFVPFLLAAQSGKITIKGQVSDTLQEKLIGATVMLLEPSDSTLLSYGKTDATGAFILKNVKRQPYLLKITYVGFVPFIYEVKENAPDLIELNTIQLKEISKELFEIVVKAAKAPMTIRGDTIEYDATTFKVPKGSSVEDLLRKLPGIEVEADGSIKAEGRDVTKVTVDGKQFFGSDPKAATKNLPAEGISKVQVFKTETEEKKLTGYDSKTQDKTMNLQLKDEYKKGGFGKLIAGVGTEKTAELKGNFNRFNPKEQFSLLGMANTTGRNGLGWNDYQDFRGSESSNWDDGGNFGFGSNRRFLIFNDDDEDGALMSNFWSGNNYGFPENYTGGVNYNYDHNKNKLSGMYFYDQKGMTSRGVTTSKTFVGDATIDSYESSKSERVNNSHKVDLRFEKELDSLNTIIANVTGTLGHRFSDGTSISENINPSASSNNSTASTHQERDNQIFRLNTIYRKKFLKKGRSLGLSAVFALNNSQSDILQQSTINFFKTANTLDSTRKIDQTVVSQNNRNQVNANAMYTEPIAKQLFWSTFYNFQNNNEDLDRQVDDIINNEKVNNNFLTRLFENQIQINRLGSFLRYSKDGINISAGMAYQVFDLKSNYKGGNNSGIAGNVNRQYGNILPNIDMDWDLGGKSIGISYSVDANEPTIRNLQPIVDNSNPLNIRVGNPDLVPQINHNINLNYYSFNPATFINLSLWGSFTIMKNQFVQEKTIDETFVSTTRTINYSGGQTLWSGINFGFPVIKNKFTLNFNYGPGYTKSIAFVNKVENITQTLRNRFGLRVNITPREQFSCYINTSLSLADTKYNINVAQNQQIIDQSYSVELNAKLFLGIYSNNSLRYNISQNNRTGFYQDIPILNMSLSKTFLKDNKGELRISAYDVFNKTVGINQYAGYNYVLSTVNESLARYFMLTFTYNIKGIKATTKSQSNWWN